MSRKKRTESEKIQQRITKRLRAIEDKLKAIGNIKEDITYIDEWSHKLYKHSNKLEKEKIN